jgi:hypothetical protein
VVPEPKPTLTVLREEGVSKTPITAAPEFTRLQSDSALRSAAVSVPAGTYNSLAVTFSDVLLTYCAQPCSGVSGGSCGSLTQVPGSAGAVIASSDALPFTATKLGLGAGCEYPERYHRESPDYFSGAPSTTTDFGSGQLAHIADLYGAVSNVSPGAFLGRRHRPSHEFSGRPG